jgi:DNA-binding response OmpR family regulator
MKRIILVEDDASIQDTVQLILESAGYEVSIFFNGEQILKDDFVLPDLFILDKQLRGVDGLDICRHLKGKLATMHIPVVMLSANPMIIQMAKDAGADFAIEKPFRMKELKMAMDRLINAESLD